MTYEDFLKLVQPNMLDANGRFLGPQAGVNFAFEGMTPQQAYDATVQRYNVVQASKADNNNHGFGGYDPALTGTLETALDPTWRPGPIDTKRGALGNWGVPLAMIAAPFAAQALGFGSSTATTSPVAGGSVTATDLSPLGSVPSGAAPGVTAGSLPSSAGYSTAADSLAASNAVPASGGLLDTVKQWVGDNPTLMKLAGAALGAAASGDTKTSATSSKDPWAPAQPYLLQNLAQNQAMSNHYNANPFSQEQQNAYQGLLNTVANSQAAGNGLLSMAQNFGQSKRGVMPQFGPLGSAQAPAINWSQYQNIGRK